MNYHEKIRAARWALFDKDSFLGLLFQELDFYINHAVPTASIGYNKKLKKHQVFFNPNYVDSITVENTTGVLIHELLHFCNGHINRFSSVDKKQWKIANIAMDMAINQLCSLESMLPKGCVNVKDWKMENGEPFPELSTAEVYFLLIMDTSGDGDHLDKNQSAKSDINKGTLEKYVPMDEHSFEELSEEEQKEIYKTIRRTIEKSSMSGTQVPGYINDLMKKLEVEINGINYKKELLAILKRSLSSPDRAGTWTRPNRRFGELARGTKSGELPSLTVYVDTSGSISHTELNEFLTVISGFLKIGGKKCKIGLWHTELYYKGKYKVNQQFSEKDIQSGGTDVNPALKDIEKSSSNLSIILTDGYIGEVPAKLKTQGDVIWVISKQGSVNHPGKHIGKTLKMS